MNRTVSGRWRCWKALAQTKQNPTTTNSTTSARPKNSPLQTEKSSGPPDTAPTAKSTDSTSGKVVNPLRFQGQYFDPESGLHYNRHRYYNPDIGRYLTPDPVKLAGGINAYQYVPNPTGWVDPLGLSSCPGENGCKTVVASENPPHTIKVKSNDPATPQPGITARSARIEVS